MKYPKQWKLVALIDKSPIKKKWNTSKKSDTIKPGQNVGIKLAFSGLCCFDLDDVKLFKKRHKGVWKDIKKSGIHYTSGKPNRVKILFRTKKPFRTITFAKGMGQLRCADHRGGTMQDVLPPSLHPEGYTYQWISDCPAKQSDIPYLPKELYKLVKPVKRGKKGKSDEYLAPYVTAYNRWAVLQGKNIEDEIATVKDATGNYAYERVFGGFKRVDSTNTLNIKIYDHDDAFNFSDNPDQPIKYGAIDFYDLLILNDYGKYTKENEEKARNWVCTHDQIRELVNEEYSKSNHPTARLTWATGKACVRELIHTE